MRLLFEIIRHILLAGFSALGVWSGWHMARASRSWNDDPLRFRGFLSIAATATLLAGLTAAIT